MRPDEACDRARLLKGVKGESVSEAFDPVEAKPAAKGYHQTDSQRRRLDRFEVPDAIDIHCHCLPNMDDGPGTMREALELCRALVKDGITTVIATPHQLGRYDGRNESSEIRRKVGEMAAALRANNIPLRVLPGGDVKIDERIPALIEQDRVMTAGDSGRYLLVELPSEFCIDPVPLMHAVRERGVELILTHPERYGYLAKEPQKAIDWVRKGLHLQITAGSLAGRFGKLAMQAAWFWLERGAVATIANDAHNVTGRRPCMSEAIAAITYRLNHHAALITCIENPLRITNGLPVVQAERGEDFVGVQ